MTAGQRVRERPAARRAPPPVWARSPAPGIFLWTRTAIWAAALFAFFTFVPNRHPLAGRWDDPSLTHDLGAYLVAMLVGGGAFAVAFPAKQAFLVQVSPSRWLGTIQGAEQTAMQLSALLGTLTAPILYDLIGGWIFAFGGGVALAGLAAAAPTLRHEWHCVAGAEGARSCAEVDRVGLAPGYAAEPGYALDYPARD